MRFKEYLQEKEDMSTLPPDVLDQLEKLIRDGAKNAEEQWSNALELVHKAYQVGQAERPTPDMDGGWKQYEGCISLAVRELTKHRGIDGDWRMSSHIFHEAAGKGEPKKYEITSTVDDLPIVGQVTADSIEDILGPIMKFNITGHDLEFKHRSPNHCCVHLHKNGKRTGDKITVKEIPQKASK